MDEKKKSVKEEVRDTMACSAYAEAGEPCPIDADKKKKEKKEEKKVSVEGTMACSAFAEAGEPCPIDTDKKKK